MPNEIGLTIRGEPHQWMLESPCSYCIVA